MDTHELLKKVRKIEIKTRGLSKHLFSGEYHSAFKGRGMSFSEVRDYQFGDDVRNIDWNVTARTGEPHVKVFEEERELTVMLLIDVSGSAFYGTVNQLKQDMMTEICAVLSFSAIQNNDKVGVIFFSDQVEKFIPPKKGRQHILRIIRELLDFQPQHRHTDLNAALEYFNNVVKKRSICFILSDFRSPPFTDPLRIAARRHDMVGIHVFDRHESTLPNVGLMRLRDLETGTERWVDTASEALRQTLHHRFREHHRTLTQSFRQLGCGFVDIRTDQSYVNALLKFFKTRAKA
ncbi:MAG: DUF58 domain-containing protein [Bacteroidetes bacterium]|nr:MAG: DUF58 domain-containing protein [Bacteroidota bacterium]